MNVIDVVLLQGGGDGAHEEDAELAESLRRHLGPGFQVRYPVMPDEGYPDYDRWRPAIAEAVDGASVLVGHSLGGFMLATYLAEARPPGVEVVCLIAAPFPGGDPDWVFEGFDLPPGFADAMPESVFLYASEDDAIVPFAHRDIYAAAIPGAVTRTTAGGHQLGGDLRVVSDDIRSALSH